MNRLTVDSYFFALVIIAGILFGVVLAAKPEAANHNLPPYLWLFVVMLVFETGAFLYGRGAPGTMIGMSTRVLGFIIGVGLMAAIVFFSGSPARLF
jgi:hypothetical protein